MSELNIPNTGTKSNSVQVNTSRQLTPTSTRTNPLLNFKTAYYATKKALKDQKAQQEGKKDTSSRTPKTPMKASGYNSRITPKLDPNDFYIPSKWKKQAVSMNIIKPLQAMKTKGGKSNRICICCRAMIPADEENGRKEQVNRHQVPEGNPFFSGLMQCGSIWICPICAPKISEARREEIRIIIETAKEHGYQILFATYTFAHQYGDNIKTMLQSFQDATRALKRERAYKNLKKRLALLGTTKALEITYSDRNGYHPHTHELFYVKNFDESELEETQEELYLIWKRVAERYGLTMNKHGFTLQTTKGDIEDYIAKFGHEPKEGKCWGVTAEMTKGIYKLSKDDKGLSMFGVLEYICFLQEQNPSPEIEKALAKYEKVFADYAVATRGLHQIQNSRNLKKRLGIIEEEKTDEELANEIQEVENAVDLSLKRPAWNVVIGNDMREEILNEPSALKVKIDLVTLFDCTPTDIILYFEDDKKGWIDYCAENAISSGMFIPKEQAEEVIENLEIESFKEVDALASSTPEQPTEREQEIIKRTRVTIWTETACKCGCRIVRPIFGQLECINCSPSPLWTLKTLADIKEEIANREEQNKWKSQSKRQV